MYGEKKLKPETAEEITLSQTSEGMRELIRRHQMHNAFLHQCMSLARHNGLGDLDTMTLLAFNSIIAEEVARDVAIQNAMLSVRPQTIGYQSSDHIADMLRYKVPVMKPSLWRRFKRWLIRRIK